MKKLITLILFVFILSGNAFGAKSYWYNATSFIGGSERAVDNLNGQNLINGDKMIVVTASGRTHIYNLDSDSALTEDSTNYSVISPDSNAGDKRWILMFSGGRVIIPDSTIDQGDADVVGTLAWHGSNASTNPTTVTVLPGTYTISTNVTVASTTTLKFTQGGILAVATTKTLTVNGKIDAGPYTIFTQAGTGAVTLGGCLSPVNASWFASINIAVESGAHELYLSPNVTYTSDRTTVTYLPTGKWRLTGAANAVIKMADDHADAVLMFQATNATTEVIVDGVSFDGNRANQNYWPRIIGTSAGNNIDRVIIRNCDFIESKGRTIRLGGTIRNVIIKNNTFTGLEKMDGLDSSHYGEAINVSTNSESVLIQGNQIWGDDTSEDDQGPNGIIVFNEGGVNSKVIVINNFVQYCGANFAGTGTHYASIDTYHGNNGITVANNRVKNYYHDAFRVESPIMTVTGNTARFPANSEVGPHGDVLGVGQGFKLEGEGGTVTGNVSDGAHGLAFSLSAADADHIHEVTQLIFSGNVAKNNRGARAIYIYFFNDVIAQGNIIEGSASLSALYIREGNLKELSFGTGVSEISAEDEITQLVSGATATVVRVILQTGEWADNDAAGRLQLIDITGTFDATNDLQVSAATKATSTSLVTADGSIIVDGNNIKDSGKYGIYLHTSTARAIISNNIIHNSAEDGIRIISVPVVARDAILVSNNIVTLSGIYGIFTSQIATIKDNEIRTTGDVGIYVQNNGGIVSGNQIYGAGDSGIKTVDVVTEMTIEGNVIHDSTEHGIEIGTSAGLSYFSINYNKIYTVGLNKQGILTPAGQTLTHGQIIGNQIVFGANSTGRGILSKMNPGIILGNTVDAAGNTVADGIEETGDYVIVHNNVTEGVTTGITATGGNNDVAHNIDL